MAAHGLGGGISLSPVEWVSCDIFRKGIFSDAHGRTNAACLRGMMCFHSPTSLNPVLGDVHGALDELRAGPFPGVESTWPGAMLAGAGEHAPQQGSQEGQEHKGGGAWRPLCSGVKHLRVPGLFWPLTRSRV